MKNNFIFLFFVFFCLSLEGCAKAFQPRPPAFKEWKKKDVTFFELKSVMLNCGYSDIEGAGKDADKNKVASIHLCMEKNGFKYTNAYGGRYCDRHPTLPACVEAAAVKQAGG